MDSEHAEGILRDVASRPHLYTSTAAAAAKVLVELDDARRRLAEAEATIAEQAAEIERLRAALAAATERGQALARTSMAPRYDPTNIQIDRRG